MTFLQSFRGKPEQTNANLHAMLDNKEAVIRGLQKRIDEQDEIMRMGARQDKTINVFLFIAGIVIGCVLTAAAHWHGLW